MLACSDPEPLAGGQIAERIGVSPAAVSRALDGLVQKGFADPAVNRPTTGASAS